MKPLPVAKDVLLLETNKQPATIEAHMLKPMASNRFYIHTMPVPINTANACTSALFIAFLKK